MGIGGGRQTSDTGEEAKTNLLWPITKKSMVDLCLVVKVEQLVMESRPFMCVEEETEVKG